MNKPNIKTFVILVLFLIPCSRIFAQQSNSLFFMDRIPQSNQLNPAIQPLSGFYFGIPGTNMEINVGNSAVGFSDVFIYGIKKDTLVYPSYNETTKNDFLGKLKPTNYIYTDNRVDLLSFGFRIQNTYLSFNLTERVEAYGYLPKDLLKFGLYFNGSSTLFANESFDISNLGFKAQWFREFGIGVSQAINPNFNFGIRAKMLLGIASVTTANSEIQLNNTGIYQWDTRANTNLNTSVPGLSVPVIDGEAQWDSIKFDAGNDFNSYRNLFWKSKNMGFALDLGIVASPVKNLTLSASLIDLGYIRWSNHVQNYSQDGQYEYRGIIIKDLKFKEDVAQVLVDSLDKIYKPKVNYEPYTTSLTGKLYLGAHYQLVKGVGFGALTRLQIVKNSIRPQYTFSLNLTSGQWLGYTISYTIAEGMYDNLGLGLVYKIGPFQTYFIIDRIPTAYQQNVGSGIPYIPKYAKSLNFRTGMNLVFGNRRKMKADKDKPFLDI